MSSPHHSRYTSRKGKWNRQEQASYIYLPEWWTLRDSLRYNGIRRYQRIQSHWWNNRLCKRIPCACRPWWEEEIILNILAPVWSLSIQKTIAGIASERSISLMRSVRHTKRSTSPGNPISSMRYMQSHTCGHCHRYLWMMIVLVVMTI